MPFLNRMNDEIKVIKSSGEEFGGLKASVLAEGFYLMRSNVLIEPNDLIQREMSNGGVETFKVIDPGYHEGLNHIPPHYQMKVKKLGLPEAEKEIKSIIFNNINGPNARVNNSSVDNSTNIVNINPEVAEHISMLRSEINRLDTPEQEKKEALELADAIENLFSTNPPNKSVVKALISALPRARNIASIGSFFLSAFAV